MKNQITLTKEAMDTLKAQPGDYVTIDASDFHVIINPVAVKEKKIAPKWLE